MSEKLKIIQCGTGIAGAQALGSIIEHPHLELAGLLVHSDRNEGRDAASFVGLPECGVHSTRDVASLIGMQADAVLYMMLVPSLDDICAFLASGKNVVTTAGFMFPRWNNAAADQRLRQACGQGGSSFYVTGINPGFVDEILPLTMSRLSRSWRSVHISEYADCAKYPSPAMLFDVMGFGKTPEDVAKGLVADMSVMTDFFSASVAALGHELGLTLDDVTQSREFALAPADLETAAGPVASGTIAGQRWRWTGIANGVERIVQETYWIVAFDLGDNWPAAGSMDGDTRWQVTIEGTPSLRCVFEARESFAGASTGTNPSGAATAMAAVNSLWHVVAAEPGILTSADLRQPRFQARN